MKYKLENYGIREVALDWFKNHLQDRRQMVKCKTARSDSLLFSCGVSQGSAVGPLLFQLYINDISKY